MKNFVNKYLIKFSIFIFLLSSLQISAESILNISKNDFILGNENAPITIIEYASLSCSHCADFHLNTLPKIIEEFVNTGIAKIVFRDF